jgi:ParB family transcriptional regulator, chromosome partitioning protein
MTTTDTAAATATAPETSYELLDPKAIIVRNIREANPSQRFIDSIREFGVLQPIGVVRDPAGPLYLRFGGRRRRACIELGCQVPAIVVTATVNTTPAEIDRIFAQLAENDDREELNAGDRAAAVQELFSLGADEATVTRRTGLGKADLAAARAIAASATARTLAAQYPLTLEQLAALAEFEGDTEAVQPLVEAAAEGPGRFAHALEDARDERADREAVAAHAAMLAERCITVADGGLHYENALYNWAGPDGERLTKETHAQCPGNVVTLFAGHAHKVSESWYCTDPKAHGHKRHGTNGNGTSQTPEDRRQVVEGNKKWRSAEKVRREFLRALLARPKVPEGGLLLVLKALARSDHPLRYAMDARADGRHVMARQLLGLPKADGSSWNRPPEVLTAMESASPARAQVIALAIVLGAYEAQTGPQSWRTPNTDTADYLQTLTRWGYDLSDIERELVAGARNKAAERAAAVKADEAVVAERESTEHAPGAAGQEAGDDGA